METEQVVSSQDYKRNSRAQFGLMLVILFVISFFHIPSAGVPSISDKYLLMVFGVSLVFLAWLFGRISTGNVSLPRSSILSALGVLWLAHLLSTLFSQNTEVSLVGNAFDPNSLTFLTVFSLIVLLTSIAFQYISRVALAYLTLFSGLFLLFIFQVSNYFLGIKLGGFLEAMNPSLVGAWYDLAVLFGLVLLVSLVFIQLSHKGAFFRKMGWFGVLLSLLVLVFVNFQTVWWMMAVAGVLLVFVFYRSNSTSVEATSFPPQNKSRITILPLVIFIISIFCLYLGRPEAPLYKFIETVVPAGFDVRPSWQGTFEITKETMKTNPIFGVGPGLFSRQWVKFKDPAVNQTNFWALDFNNGIGYIPSMVVTTGLLGLLAILVLLYTLMRVVVRAIFGGAREGADGAYLLATAISVLYLWFVSIFYTPGYVVLFLTAFLTGLLIALLAQKGTVQNVVVSSSIYPKLKIIFSVLVIVLGLGVLSFLYGQVGKYRGLRAYGSSVAVAAGGDIDRAVTLAERATTLDGVDTYHRHASDVYLAALVRANASLDPSGADTAAILGRLYQAGLSHAQESVKYDPTNYLNYLKLGGVYEATVSLGVPGAYEEAIKAYQRARELNPTSPAIPYVIARLEVLRQNIPGAVEHLNQSLTLKQSYAPAFMLASQIALSEGDLETAIRAAESGVASDPSDYLSVFQLGYLRYRNGDYQLSSEILTRALELNSEYVNARYFLGLAFAKLGQKNEALVQLEKVRALNPDNSELLGTIRKVKSGSLNFE